MSQKLLVIDDSIASAKVAEGVLTRHFNGGDVVVAQRAIDAFDRFNVAQPDLILLNETMPDLDAETICYRLLNDAATAKVPVVLMASNGAAEQIEARYPNVVWIIEKPFTAEGLQDVLESFMPKGRGLVNPARSQLFHDPSRAVFSGHTHFFSLRAALQMASGDKLTGVLRFFLNRAPIEVFISKGRVLLATTRNAQLYCSDSPTILSSTNLGTLMEAQVIQHHTGCPIFLYLSAHGGFPHDDVVQLTREHGQRLFANLWTAGRVHFEFEQLDVFPDFVKSFPPAAEDSDNWVLGTLRYVRYENLMANQRPDPNGSPAYTRKGYELIQTLKLNETEARFASAINGTDSLPAIAKKVGISLSDALLIVFRFSALEIIDFWSSSVLSLTGGQSQEADASAA
jgi:CheY-like chemotaxis protein